MREDVLENRDFPNWLCLALLSAITAYSVLFTANPLAQSNQTTHRFLCFGMLMFGLIGFAFNAFQLQRKLLVLNQLLIKIAFFLPGYALFQSIPLPMQLVRILSPVRAELADALGGVLHQPSWVSLSVDPASTISHGLLFTSCAVIFSLVYQTAYGFSERPWVMVVPLCAIALCEAFFGLTQISTTNNDGIIGTFGIRNHYAGFLEMLLPFAAVYPIQVSCARDHRRIDAKSSLKMCLGGGTAVLLFVAILYSLSRMGLAASLVSLVEMSLIGSLGNRSRMKTRMVMITTIMLLTLALLMPTSLILRFKTIEEQGRVPIWHETLSLIGDYPFWGCGLGGFLSAFVRYKQSAPSFTQDYAHNDYLQYFSELGLAGFAVIVIFFAMIIGGLQKGWTKDEPQHKWLSLACIGSLSAIALHSFADFNLYVPANMITLSWILGVAAYCGNPLTRVRPRERTVIVTESV